LSGVKLFSQTEILAAVVVAQDIPGRDPNPDVAGE
jgi:hypothetical protein